MKRAEQQFVYFVGTEGAAYQRVGAWPESEFPAELAPIRSLMHKRPGVRKVTWEEGKEIHIVERVQA